MKHLENIVAFYFQNLCTRTSELEAQFESPGQILMRPHRARPTCDYTRSKYRILANILFYCKSCPEMPKVSPFHSPPASPSPSFSWAS